MVKKNDREYELKRQIKDLNELVFRLKEELAILKRKQEKEKPLEKTVKKQSSHCPNCGAALIAHPLPHGTLELCGKKCGYRAIKRAKK